MKIFMKDGLGLVFFNYNVNITAYLNADVRPPGDVLLGLVSERGWRAAERWEIF